VLEGAAAGVVAVLAPVEAVPGSVRLGTGGGDADDVAVDCSRWKAEAEPRPMRLLSLARPKAR
jgi:hypothetical protein